MIEITRRSVLAGAALMPGVALAMPMPMPTAEPIRTLIVDVALPNALAQAERWAPILGATLLPFSGDITPIWLAHIDRRAGRIAGVTDAHILFCLQLLARGRWRRLELVADGDGLRRWIIGAGVSA